MARKWSEIIELLEELSFKRRLFGGVDEEDVWKKIEMLHNEYAKLIESERNKAQGIINEWQKCSINLAKQLKDKDEQLKYYRTVKTTRNLHIANKNGGNS